MTKKSALNVFLNDDLKPSIVRELNTILALLNLLIRNNA